MTSLVNVCDELDGLLHCKLIDNKQLELTYTIIIANLEGNKCSYVEIPRLLCQLYVLTANLLFAKNIEKLYVRLLKHPQSKMKQYVEFFCLSQTIVYLLVTIVDYGVEHILGSKISLPFENLACIPAKYGVTLRDETDIVKLLNLWCSVYQQLACITTDKNSSPYAGCEIAVMVFKMSALVGKCVVDSQIVRNLSSAVEVANTHIDCNDERILIRMKTIHSFLEWMNLTLEKLFSEKAMTENSVYQVTDISITFSAVTQTIELLIKSSRSMSCGQSCCSWKDTADQIWAVLFQVLFVLEKQHAILSTAAVLQTPHVIQGNMTTTVKKDVFLSITNCLLRLLLAISETQQLSVFSSLTAGISPMSIDALLLLCGIDQHSAFIVCQLLIKEVQLATLKEAGCIFLDLLLDGLCEHTQQHGEAVVSSAAKKARLVSVVHQTTPPNKTVQTGLNNYGALMSIVTRLTAKCRIALDSEGAHDAAAIVSRELDITTKTHNKSISGTAVQVALCYELCVFSLLALMTPASSHDPAQELLLLDDGLKRIAPLVDAVTRFFNRELLLERNGEAMTRRREASCWAFLSCVCRVSREASKRGRKHCMTHLLPSSVQRLIAKCLDTTCSYITETSRAWGEHESVLISANVVNDDEMHNTSCEKPPSKEQFLVSMWIFNMCLVDFLYREDSNGQCFTVLLEHRKMFMSSSWLHQQLLFAYINRVLSDVSALGVNCENVSSTDLSVALLRLGTLSTLFVEGLSVNASPSGTRLIHAVVVNMLEFLTKAIRHSFNSSQQESTLNKALRYSPALPLSLKTVKDGEYVVEQDFFLIQLMCVMCWQERAQLFPNEMMGDKQIKLPPDVVHTVAKIRSIIEPLLAMTVTHLEQFVSRVVRVVSETSNPVHEDDSFDSESASPWFADCNLMDGSSGRKITSGNVDSKRHNDLHQGDCVVSEVDCLLNMNTFLHCRAMVAVVSLCSSDRSSGAFLASLAIKLDAMILRLLESQQTPLMGLIAKTRFGQILSISLLDHSLRSSFNTIDIPFQQCSILQGTVACLTRPSRAKSPSLLCSVIGAMRFIKYSAIISPQNAIFVLGTVFRAWLRLELDDKWSMNVLNEELMHLAQEGVFRHLMVAHAELAIEHVILPLLYADVEHNVLADFLIFRAIIPLLEKGNGGGGCVQSVDKGHYWRVIASKVVATVVTAPQDDHTLTAVQVLGTISRMRFLPLQVPHCETYLIDGYPSVLYHILSTRQETGLSVLQTDLRSIVGGKLQMILEHTAKALGKQMFQVQHADGTILQSTQLHEVLEALVWDLGSDNSGVSLAASNGLSVLSFLYVNKAWKVPAVGKGSAAELMEQMFESVAEILADNFLYLMANVLLLSRHSTSPRGQVQCLKALQAIVRRLKQSELSKILPKILVELGLAFTEGTASVQLHAVRVIAELIQRLHVDALCSNLSSLVVVLFPLLEMEYISTFHLDTETSLAINDMCAHSNLARNARFFPHSSIDTVRDSPFSFFSDDIVSLGSVCFCAQMNNKCRATMRREAVDVIRSVLVSRRGDIRDAVYSIAYIPDIEELRDVQMVHTQDLKSMTLKQSLQQLCQMLKHDSRLVRILALSRLCTICKEHINHLYEEILVIHDTRVDTSPTCANLVSFLLQELLQLSTREVDQTVLVACSKCLGEIGAIDPGRVAVRLAVGSGQHAKTGKCPEGQQFLPWNVSSSAQMISFGLYLLEHHMLPGLRSASLAEFQDKSGFAIQRVLRRLDVLMQSGESNQVVGEGDPMPERLQAKLSSRGLLEASEAFWSTGYKMENRLMLRAPPIYFPGLSFARWISLWTRFLIKQSRGDLQHLFEACRGLVRHRSELCQFLLPHLIVNILCNYESTDETVTIGIIQELNIVLRDSRDNTVMFDCADTTFQSVKPQGEFNNAHHQSQHSQLCIQSVFVLLDTLKSWLSVGAEKKSDKLKSFSTSSTTLSSALTSSIPVSMERIQQVLGHLFEMLPTSLLCSSAMKIHAYARALRYIETSTRERHRLNNFCSTVSKSVVTTASLKLEKAFHDRAGGVLPTLNESELNNLQQIFAQLEDCDGLQGVQVVRQLSGVKSTIWSRIVTLEHSDDWLGTHLEYGLLHNSAKYANFLHHHNLRLPTKSLALQNSDSFRDKHNDLSVNHGDIADVANANSLTCDSECFSLKEIEDIEKGRLRCLVEMGQLEAVIDQTVGITQRLPELELALLPMGVQASWKLMRWDDLNGFLARNLAGVGAMGTKECGNSCGGTDELVGAIPDSDLFQLSVGKLLLSVHNRDSTTFNDEMTQTRVRTMTSLSAASMESYNRAYPLMSRLHILQEIESGYAMLLSDPQQCRENRLKDAMWEQRLLLVAPSISQRETIMAVRRSLLKVGDMSDALAQNWLQTSRSMSQFGRFDAAHMAVRNAEVCGLNSEEVLLQKCRILKDRGDAAQALMLLEPVEIDVSVLERILKKTANKRSTTLLPPSLDSEAKRHRLAERIQLATQLMVDSRQKQGKGIIDRYLQVIALHPTWDRAYFDSARYYEYLYNETKSKETGIGNNRSSTSNYSGVADDALSYSYMIEALHMYCSCLRCGEGRLAIQALPRMLTLWLSFTSLVDTEPTSKKTGSQESPLRIAQAKANDAILSKSASIPESVWFMCMPQLVSRVGHRNAETLTIITTILQRILTAFPKQGIWHLAGISHSGNSDRKRIARKLLQDTYKAIQSTRKEDALMLVDSQKLFSNLINLATHQCKDKVLKWLGPEVILSRFLVPTQDVLHHVNPLSHVSAVSDANNYSQQHLQFIASFHDTVAVASSKAKPKTLTLITTSGVQVRFLCKQEKDGDLRKDARMMEFNSVVNRLMQEAPEGARRNLRLRTFAVVCLNEECGILEWVNNTECIRTLIDKAHSYWPDLYPRMGYKEIYQNFMEFQSKEEESIAGMVRGYTHVVEAYRYRPCFHKWFVERFVDPTEWLEARTTFTRSAAVWSGVGHVIGLGDRHTENILIDQSNGECVHVDFDCLFDKGLSLARPEIVPFRLTPNMVDAMGVTGVEGAFRTTLSVCIGLLRENKDTLLSVLEPFLRDPTVSWSRSGRAQRNDTDMATASSKGGQQSVNVGDMENKEARVMLQKISERLSGVYNISHPHREKFIRAYLKRGEELPPRGLGAGKDETLSLSVQGQVQRLIDEATAEENLAQLYIGWQPWV